MWPSSTGRCWGPRSHWGTGGEQYRYTTHTKHTTLRTLYFALPTLIVIAISAGDDRCGGSPTVPAVHRGGAGGAGVPV